MSQQQKIKLENGVEANFGGRYTFQDKETGEKNLLDIFYVDQEKAYRAADQETFVLTPTASWTHELGDGPWQRFHKNGIKRIVLSKQTWNEVKIAEEIEPFDPETYEIISNLTGKVVEKLEREEPESKKEKKKKKNLDNISEKVTKNMSTNNTLDMIKEAGIDAAKMAGANQANEIITAGMKKGLGALGLTNEFLESEAGHNLMKLIGPLGIHYVASTQAEYIDNLIGSNASENIKEGCKFATQAAIGDVIGPLMEFLVPMLKELATVGVNSIASAGSASNPEAKEDKGSNAVAQLLKNKQKESVST